MGRVSPACTVGAAEGTAGCCCPSTPLGTAPTPTLTATTAATTQTVRRIMLAPSRSILTVAQDGALPPVGCADSSTLKFCMQDAKTTVAGRRLHRDAAADRSGEMLDISGRSQPRGPGGRPGLPEFRLDDRRSCLHAECAGRTR